MSRGPGRWQRAILDALQAQDYVSAWHIFPRGYGRRERFVFRRAAQRLAQQGLVTVEQMGLDLCVTRRQNSDGMSHLGAAEVSVTRLKNS